MMKSATVTVVGGVYRELCMHPRWDRFFGSGGRAAAALAEMGVPVELYTYLDDQAGEVFGNEAALSRIKLHRTPIEVSPTFYYTHGLSVPAIYGNEQTSTSMRIKAENVLRFGMIEGDAIIEAERAVYDPQNAEHPSTFSANGSNARELAVILNRHEADLFLGECRHDDETAARTIARRENAEVVVLKRGPRGALVFDRGDVSVVPAYRTPKVWKIGSGDNFAAHFAAAWLHDGLSAGDAAARASRATAYFCENGGFFPSREAIAGFERLPMGISSTLRKGNKPTIYLAGPFFNLQQLWLVEEARNALMAMGLQVLSPYHDIGHGSAEDVVEKDLEAIRSASLVLALVDGLDAGTIYEIGYARAIGLPVVAYSECESPEDRKMMEGSGCIMTDDFVTAIYQSVWQVANV